MFGFGRSFAKNYMHRVEDQKVHIKEVSAAPAGKLCSLKIQQALKFCSHQLCKIAVGGVASIRPETTHDVYLQSSHDGFCHLLHAAGPAVALLLPRPE